MGGVPLIGNSNVTSPLAQAAVTAAHVMPDPATTWYNNNLLLHQLAALASASPAMAAVTNLQQAQLLAALNQSSMSGLNPTLTAGVNLGGFAALGSCAGIPQPGGINLLVQNLAPDADEATLWRLFCPFGALTSVKIARDNHRLCKGYAFVTMCNYDESLAAIQSVNGTVLSNRTIQV